MRKIDLKTVYIDNLEKIFLDGEEIKNVESYKLENSAVVDEPAKLTVTVFVNVGKVGSG